MRPPARAAVRAARGRRRVGTFAFWLCVTLASACACAGTAGTDDLLVRVGSKNFSESYLLAEIHAQLLEAGGVQVERRFGLGGTLLCYQALRTGEIDLYIEYTGTIAETILDAPSAREPAALAALLAPEGLALLAPLGFDNTYAIAVPGGLAQRLDLVRVSDLAVHPELRVAFSHEFLERADGWPGLARTYGLQGIVPTGIEHGLAYRALSEGRADVTDAYSTDGDIDRYALRLLVDDAAYFPRYLALPLVRADLDPRARALLAPLAGRLDEARMRALNARVVQDGASFAAVAARFLRSEGLVADAGTAVDERAAMLQRLRHNTIRHLQLTVAALLLAILVGVPLGVAVHGNAFAANTVLYVTGLLQTIPSIALLALMIPLLGIGVVPAVVALFAYALLPIVRSTVTALLSIDPLLRRVAIAIGLTPLQQVRYLQLPLALPNLLAGVRTAAVISIGTATLAAFIGAGGLGGPIVTGLALNDPGMILEGALPAAGLAILTELLFEGIERVLIPPHLLTRNATPA